MKTVVGLLNNKLEARNAVQELMESGFPRESIKIMTSEDTRQSLIGGVDTQEPFFEPGSGLGVLSGSSDTAPLTNMGVLDEDASIYAEGVERGGFLVTVSADDYQCDKAVEILQRHGAIDTDEQGRSLYEEGYAGRSAGLGQELPTESRLSEGLAAKHENVIPVVEEEIQVGKREVQKGRVRVFSRISEVPVQEELQLHEEHAKVERRPVDRPVTDIEREAFQERSFEVSESAEEPVISKQARVKEEVLISTEGSERTEVIRDTLRRTEVEVERMDESHGQRDVSAMSDDEFISHFNATYGQSGERFEETYRSAYHFAESESSLHPQLRDRDWPEVEEFIHQDWEMSHPGTWNRVEQAIHFGWDRCRRH